MVHDILDGTKEARSKIWPLIWPLYLRIGVQVYLQTYKATFCRCIINEAMEMFLPDGYVKKQKHSLKSEP